MSALDVERAALANEQLAVDRESERLDGLTAELARLKETADAKLAGTKLS